MSVELEVTTLGLHTLTVKVKSTNPEQKKNASPIKILFLPHQCSSERLSERIMAPFHRKPNDAPNFNTMATVRFTKPCPCASLFHGKGCHQLLNDNKTSLHKACNCSDETCNTNWSYFKKCNKLTYRFFIIQVFTDVRHPTCCIKEPEHHHP